MKKEKFTLQQIKIASFITKPEQNELKGAGLPTTPIGGCSVSPCQPETGDGCDPQPLSCCNCLV